MAPPASPVDPFEGVTVESLRRRGARKWTRYPDDVIPAWIADADANVCPAVRDAIDDLLDRGDLVYPSDTGEDEVAAETLYEYFDRIPKDGTFGNGRTARKVFEVMADQQATRLAMSDRVTAADMTLLMAEDFRESMV